MDRVAAVKKVIKKLKKDELLVITTGFLSRDVCFIKDRPNNFYMAGSMGYAYSIGIGLALSTKKKVTVISGDGAVLMNLGSLVLGNYLRLQNLKHYIINNQAYASTGGQKTCSNAFDFSQFFQKDRLATERDGELKPHTAHSWGLVRPQVFGLLMIDPGWRNQPPGNNGESILVRWKDIFLEMAERFPNTYEEDWAVLKSTNILFTAAHLPDPPANEPIIVELGSKFDIGVRYKENMLSVIERLIPQIPNGERYCQSFSRFDQVVQTTASGYEFPMESGDLYLVDNRRVGHARKPFEAERMSSETQPIYNPRFLLNIHILNL